MMKLTKVLMIIAAAWLLLISLCPWFTPPTYDLWKVRLVTREWGGWCLAIAALASLALMLSLLKARTHAQYVSLGLTLSSIAFFLLPLIDTCQKAQECSVPLSPGRYFGGHATTYDARVERNVEFSPGLSLDIYRPQSRTEAPIPAVLVIHGGGWNHGGKGDYEKFNRWLANNGYAAFDVDYRLAGPQVQFPAQADDVTAALRWIEDHANEYGVAPDRIAMLGRSAGAQLALLTAYKSANTVRAHDGTQPRETPDHKYAPVRAVVAFYGPTDMVWGYNNIVDPDVINSRFLLENYLGGNPDTAKESYASASPINFVTPTCPATLLIHGKLDNIVALHHSDVLFEKLTKDSVPAEVLALPTGDHAFDVNFDGWNSQIEQAVVLRFLKERL